MKPLDPIEDEPEEAHRAFVAWALSKPRKLPQDVHMARRWDWQGRAARYDSPPKELPGTATTQVDNTTANIRRLLDLEVGKYLRQSEDNPEAPVLAPGELIRLVQLAKDLDTSAKTPQTETQVPQPLMDYSNLTDEEFELVERVAKIQREKAKK